MPGRLGPERRFNRLFRLYENGHVPGDPDQAGNFDRLQLLTPYRAGLGRAIGINTRIREVYRPSTLARPPPLDRIQLRACGQGDPDQEPLLEGKGTRAAAAANDAAPLKRLDRLSQQQEGQGREAVPARLLPGWGGGDPLGSNETGRGRVRGGLRHYRA